MKIETLYHWSPSDRRDSILRQGLQPHSAPVVHSGTLTFPYLCFGTTPARAWAISGAMPWHEVENWDCWEVRVGAYDNLDVLSFQGPDVQEVRLRGQSVPAERLWLVGTRETHPPARSFESHICVSCEEEKVGLEKIGSNYVCRACREERPRVFGKPK